VGKPRCVTRFGQEPREQHGSIEAIALSVHQYSDRAAQHAAVWNPGCILLHPLEQSVRAPTEMFHYIGGIPAVAWSVALAVGNGPKAFLEDREALGGGLFRGLSWSRAPRQ
jgi:hypothetical protein